MAISLSKNEGISLDKVAPTLTVAVLGLGWASRKKGLVSRFLGGSDSEIDLDASVLGYTASGRRVEEVWFRRLVGRGIKHSGDDRVGGGSGDNETITVSLNDINPEITTLIFTVNSFLNDTFNDIKDAYVRLCDGSTKEEIARFTLSGSGNHTGLIMCTLKRVDNAWRMQAIGRETNGRTFQEIRELSEYV